MLIADGIRLLDLWPMVCFKSLSIIEFLEKINLARSLDVTVSFRSSILGSPASTKIFLTGVVGKALILLLAA